MAESSPTPPEVVTTGPRLYTREDGKRVLEGSYHGNPHRYVEGGESFIEVAVDGVLAWREAHWVTTIAGQLYSKHGCKTDFAPELQPKVNAKRERLDTSEEGRYTITTIV